MYAIRSYYGEALFERIANDFAARGYDVVRLDFSHIPFREIESLEEAVAVAQSYNFV